MSEWIAVIDRVPDTQAMVLIHSPTSHRGAVLYGFYGFSWGGQERREWFVQTRIGNEPVTYAGGPVTHWMPLPEPPMLKPQLALHAAKQGAGK